MERIQSILGYWICHIIVLMYGNQLGKFHGYIYKSVTYYNLCFLKLWAQNPHIISTYIDQMFQFYAPLYPEGFHRGVCSCNIHILIYRTFYSGKHGKYSFFLWLLTEGLFSDWFEEISKILSVKSSDCKMSTKWNKKNIDQASFNISILFCKCNQVIYLLR